MSKTIVAIFDNFEYAEKAAREIKDRGLKTDDISLVARQSDGEARDTAPTMRVGAGTDLSTDTATRLASDVESRTHMGADTRGVNDNISDGVVTGGILGGLAGLLIGAGSMVIPGLGIVAAAGPITGLLSGAVTGGIVGGLVDLGIPENRGKQYESDIREGKILFSMRTDEDKINEISNILRSNGAVSVDTY